MNDLLSHIRWLDVLDVLLVAWLLYRFYHLVKGTAALNIFFGILSIYLIYLVVDALNMKMLSKLLGQFTGVGVIALMIVFQQELRRFLLMLGKTGFSGQRRWLRKLFNTKSPERENKLKTDVLVTAVENLQKDKTGALIIITDQADTGLLAGGVKLNAELTSDLLENIFFKNSPLHDGAVVIQGNKVLAARVILPLTESINLSQNLGLRHRAAIGCTELYDVIAVVVSEQTGKISFVHKGVLDEDLTTTRLKKRIREAFVSN